MCAKNSKNTFEFVKVVKVIHVRLSSFFSGYGIDTMTSI